MQMQQFRWVFAVHVDGQLFNTIEAVLSYSGPMLALAYMKQNYGRWGPPYGAPMGAGDQYKLTVIERHTWTPGEDPPLVA